MCIYFLYFIRVVIKNFVKFSWNVVWKWILDLSGFILNGYGFLFFEFSFGVYLFEDFRIGLYKRSLY